MEQNAEQNWVHRAAQGEPAAIAELFRLYWRAARAAAYGVTGNFALAEDAASESFYTAIEKLADLRDTRRFGPWLRTIVVRKARGQKAKTSKENGAELQTMPDGKSSPPGADLERQELVALIHEAVGHLSENLREAVVLFYFEGYNLKEAAGFLDIPAEYFKVTGQCLTLGDHALAQRLGTRAICPRMGNRAGRGNSHGNQQRGQDTPAPE